MAEQLGKRMGSQEKLAPAERVRLWRIAHRNDPAYRKRRQEEGRKYRRKIKNDPERYQEYLTQMRIYTKRYHERKKQERTDLNKICPICGEEFRAYKSNQKICPKEACKKKNKSIQTYATYKKKRALTYQGCFKNCVVCGQKFQAKRNAICCSRECSRKRINERKARYYKEKKSMTSKREEAIVKIFVQGMLGAAWENLASVNRQLKKCCPEFSPKVGVILEAVDNLQTELRESTPKFTPEFEELKEDKL